MTTEALTLVQTTPDAGDYQYDIITVPVAQLFIDHTYQRRMYKGRVARLVKEWDWAQYSPIMVVARKDGRYAVLDGQQRTLAALELGIKELPAVLRIAEGLGEEAIAFLGINNSMPGGAGEKFRARLVAKDAEAEQILGLVRSQGFDLNCALPEGQAAGPWTISAVMAVQQIAKMGMLVQTLGAIRHAWGNQPHRDMVITWALQGWAYAIRHASLNGVQVIEFADKIGRLITPSEAEDRSHSRFESMGASRSHATAYAAVLVETYNYHLSKGALPAFTKAVSMGNRPQAAGHTLNTAQRAGLQKGTEAARGRGGRFISKKEGE